MASGSGKIKLFNNTIVNVITEYESQADFAPTIYQKYHRGEFIEVFNGTWFMTDLSKIDNIIPKPIPLFFGLQFFDTTTPEEITYVMTGNSGQVISGYDVEENHTLRYIDGGEDYYQTGVRNESNNFGFEPRSNTELYSTINRSDIDGFDYPEFSVRGARKITEEWDTLCGINSNNSNRSNYIWYFGENAGIDFNPIESGETPTTISGSVITSEGSSTISDKTGKLLFYTNGETIYTSGHTIMTNGSGLNGNTGSTQSSLIVPKPNSNKYYVFTTNYDGGNNGLKYSIVNMDLQSGEGQVESKNISLIANGLTEKVAGAKHSNGTDYWVITHKTGDTKFYSYKIYDGGISTPIISTVGSINNTPRGYLKVSHDSTKIVNALYDEDIIDIMDFTPSAGTISNLITITGFTFDNGPYGVEFSSDSSKLYISDGAQGKIYQYDLTLTSATDIKDYSIVVADITGNTNGSIQMGPDEKIYVANFDGDKLHVIHNPNGLGVNCNFEENSIELFSGTTSKWGLPNLINDNILSCDRYVYVSPFGDDNFNFEFTINDVTNVIEDKELNFFTEIYKYDYINKIFRNDPVFVSDIISYSAFTSSTINIPISGTGEGEFLIKGYYEHPKHTFVGKQLGYRTNTIDTRKKGDLYGLYNPVTDWYFLNMYEADTPYFRNSIISQNITAGSIIVTSFFTLSGLSAYTYEGSVEPLVSYNGSVLGKDIDYVLSGSQINLQFEVLDNQILTLAYVEGGSLGGFYVDTTIADSINSGATDTQTVNDKLYYNTDFSKYEYYLDSIPNGDTTLILNGSVLINGVEYYKSTTNKTRIILEVNIKDGDIIQSIYVPETGYVGSINTTEPNITWSISNAPISGQNGTFTLQFVDFTDKTFDNILYSATTPYVVDQLTYSASVSLSGGSFGDKFLYRVINEKSYIPISGENVTSIKISETVPIQITTNSINSY